MTGLRLPPVDTIRQGDQTRRVHTYIGGLEGVEGWDRKYVSSDIQTYLRSHGAPVQTVTRPPVDTFPRREPRESPW